MRGTTRRNSWRAVPLGVLSVTLALVSTVLLSEAAWAQPAFSEREEGASGVDAAAGPDPYELIAEASDASAARGYRGREQVLVMADGVAHQQQVQVAHAAGEPATGLLPSGHALVAALTDRFRPVFAGATTMAGRPAYQVDLRARSGQRMATIWVDKKTCLPLGRTLYNSAGRLVRTSRYVTMQVMPARPEAAASAQPVTTGTPVAVAGLAGMRAEGWAVPDQLTTGLTLFDVRTTGTGAAEVVHLSYSDGLTSLSVFEQRGRLPDRVVTGWTSRALGGTQVWVWPSTPDQVSWAAQGRVFTVVSDDPGRLGGAVSGLPHPTEHSAPGVVDRFRHGVHRIWSWVNPF